MDLTISRFRAQRRRKGGAGVTKFTVNRGS